MKTVQAEITKSLLWAVAAQPSVSWDNVSCHWVKRFLPKGGVKVEFPLKSRYFTAIGRLFHSFEPAAAKKHNRPRIGYVSEGESGIDR